MEQAVDMIKKAFELQPYEKHESDKSFYGEDEKGTHFYFDKRQYTRDDVVDKMLKMFSDVKIDGGWVSVEPMTLLWTVVHVMKDGAEEEE